MTTPHIEQQIEQWRQRSEKNLDKWLPSEKINPVLLHEAMRYSVLNGGKRIRPILVYAAGYAVAADEAALDAPASAVEFIHAYSLVHDDLPSMDDDDLRRGRATCHKVYGEAMAILAGDALLTEAFRIMSKEIDSQELAGALVNELSEAAGAGGMVGGQSADILAEQSGGDAEKLQYIHSHKTGKLIRASCRMGALTAGADELKLKAVSDYGEAVGMAFQVIDDLLDMNGNSEILGKSAGKDDRAGKLTYPSVLGSEAAQQKVRSLNEKAAAALKPLGERGQKLLLLSGMLAQRVA
ncbi:MAG: polyprenyl synthetase family protein [Anaerolineales bacterium]|nr:polyprenyl synthetase family protein [Anaerolineales bacterium]